MRSVLLFFFVVLFSLNSLAQTRTWVGLTTNWNTASNWSPSGAPGSGNNAIIPAAPTGGNFPLITAVDPTIQVRNININGTLNMTGGRLECFGTWTKLSTASFNASGGTTAMRATTGTQSIQGGPNNFYHLEIMTTGTGIMVLRDQITVNGDLTFTSGELTTGLTGAAYTVTVNGNWVSNGGKFTPKLGLVVLGGTADATLSGTSALATTFYDLVINKTSGYEALISQKALTIGNSLEIQQGEFRQNPVAGVDLKITTDLRIIGDAAFFMANTAGTADLEVQIGRNLIDFNIIAPSRNAGTNFAVGLNYTDRFALFTFNSSNAGVTQAIRGFGVVVASNVANNLTQGLRLPAVNIATASTVYLENEGASFRGDCNITTGTLKLNGKTLLFGTGLASPNAGTLTVSGTGVLDCDANSTLMGSSVDANGPLFTTGGGGGKIRFVGGGVGSQVRINRDATSGLYYRITIASGGTLEARYFNISLIRGTGIVMNPGSILGAAPLNFSDCMFNEADGAGVNFLTLNCDIPGGTTIENTIFNFSQGTVKNCVRSATAVGVVTFKNSSGVKTGPANETDPADPTPGGVVPDNDGQIQWISLGLTRTWSGAVSTDWHNTGNWVGGVVPIAVDDAIIPTVATARYPVLLADVFINNVTITATPAAAATSVLTTNGFNMNINGSLVKTGTNGTVFNSAGSTMTISYTFSFPAAARFSAATTSTTVFAGSSAWDLVYTFGDVRILGAVFVSNNGTNTIVNNLRLSAGNLIYVNNLAQLNVRGNWLNDGGDFTPVGGRVNFVSNTAGTKTITSNGIPFSTALFQPTANTVYQLQDDMTCVSASAFSTATDGTSLRLVGSSAGPVELQVNGKKLTVNNIEIDGGGSGTANQTKFTLNGGSVLAIGGGYTLRVIGIKSLISFVGTASNRILVTRSTTSGNYTFNLSGVANNVAFAYTDFEYMDGAGINLTNSTIDATNNLSFCSFSNFTSTAGTLLNLPNTLLGPVQKVRFYYAGTPVVGTHFNVTRSSAGTGAATFTESKGILAGPVYEKDPTGTTTPGNIIWTATNIYWGNFTSGNWNDSPSKWRDLSGAVVPVPTSVDNVILDHTHCAGSYTVTVDAPGASCFSLSLMANATPITLNSGTVDVTINGDFEMNGPNDTYQTGASQNTYCLGTWLMNNGIFVPGTGSTVYFTGISGAITNGPTNKFENIVINSSGNTMRLVDDMRVNKNLSLLSGTLDVGTGNNNITMLAGNWVGTAGKFTPRNGTVILKSTTTQSITNSNAQQFYNLQIDKTSAHVQLNSDIYIQGTLMFTPTNVGRINTGSNTVRMQIAASPVGVSPTGSNGYVNGRMSYQYNISSATLTRFFTIGKFPDYLPFELSVQLTSPVLTEIVGEQFNSAPTGRIVPTTPDSIIAVSNVHYWKIDKLGATGVANAQVTLNYSSKDIIDMSVVDEDHLRILKSSADNLHWDNLTPLKGAYGSTSLGFHISSANWTTFSDFVFGKAYVQVFPVEMLSFKAKYDEGENKVRLNWLTATETNNAGFILKRGEDSFDVMPTIAHYQSESMLVGKGTTTNVSQYEYDDAKDLKKGATYLYRLYQVDYNGATKEAGVASVTIPSEGTMVHSVYPNPTKDLTHFEFYLEKASSVEVAVYDLLGHKVADLHSGRLDEGDQRLDWNVENIAPGAYTYQIIVDGKMHAGKVVVSK